MRLHLWGTDFRRSTAEMRQRLFLPTEERAATLARLKAAGFADLVYLHTCNRVEFYTTGQDLFTDSRPQWLRLLAELGLGEDDFYRGYHLEGKSALRHLLRVACSLESLVVGEPQILGQLKDSLKFSRENAIGVTESLDRVFSFVFATAKAVRTETAIGAKPVSIATLGLRCVEEQETAIPLRKVVLVGRSPMCLVVREWLRKNRPNVPIVWVNRTVEALESTPGTDGTRLRPLDSFLKDPEDFSHLFTATASREPLFGKDFFQHLTGDARRMVLDFAEPPDVDAQATPASVSLITIGGLEVQARANSEHRERAVAQAEAKIDSSLREYVMARKESPWLKEFSGLEPRLAEELIAALAKLPENLTPEERTRVAEFGKVLLRRSLHASREQLRAMLRAAAEDVPQDG